VFRAILNERKRKRNRVVRTDFYQQPWRKMCGTASCARQPVQNHISVRPEVSHVLFYSVVVLPSNNWMGYYRVFNLSRITSKIRSREQSLFHSEMF
jgi:hypothetical protein